MIRMCMESLLHYTAFRCGLMYLSLSDTCSHSHLSPWFRITRNTISGFVYRASGECQTWSQQLEAETWKRQSVLLERTLWLQIAETQVACTLEKDFIGSHKQSMRKAVPGMTTTSSSAASSVLTLLAFPASFLCPEWPLFTRLETYLQAAIRLTA